MSTPRALADAWRQARRVVVLTGAGLSTASGIPDFRSPGGRWERYQPVPLPEFLASERAREAYWRYKGETWQLICAAEPNAAHAALADLARAGRIDLLVTQNVDGLHERSGFPPERLVNIHGTDSAVECMACHRRAPRAVAQAVWEAGTAVPRCDCGGPWKPATISFGQQLVAVDLERALDAAAACDLFVAAGTSLVVGPVNQMFPVAREAGARTAIVTASETPYDAAADVLIGAPVEQVLAAVPRACEASLRRLGTDRLDCYLLHWPGRHPLAETIAAFARLRREGKIRAWGVSNFGIEELERAAALAGAERIACNQVLYHLEERTIEHAVIPWCVARGIAVVGYSPFGSGRFPGPRSRGGRVLARSEERRVGKEGRS